MQLNIFKFLLIFILSYQYGFANEQDDIEVLEKEFDQIDWLEDTEELDLLTEYINREKISSNEVNDFSWVVQGYNYLQDDDRVRTMFIKENTVIFDKDNNGHKVNKELYVKCYQRKFADSFSYILDKKGNIKFLVQNDHLVHIDPISDINEKPPEFEIYEAPNLAKYSTDILEFNNQVNFYVENFNTQYLYEFSSKRENGIGYGTKAEFVSYLDWNMNLEFGLSTTYFYGFVQYDKSNNFELNIWNIGPQIRYPFGEWETANIYLHTGVQKSLIHQVRNMSTEEFIQFSGTSWNLGIHGILAYLKGKITFGFNFQRTWISYRESDNPGREFTQIPRESRDNSTYALSGFLGYEFGFGI